ncbi:hypothetical protein Fmac_001524 [Flemingia macrophylla]|uniref:Uncharacterized protein n=1 Tax=Flemingia macrophylla TaxID=520843 RepID=A0ABD1NHD5_9FABA
MINPKLVPKNSQHSIDQNSLNMVFGKINWLNLPLRGGKHFRSFWIAMYRYYMLTMPSIYGESKDATLVSAVDLFLGPLVVFSEVAEM